MSAPDYSIDAGASVCCRLCDARRNCHSTVKACYVLRQYAEMRRLSAQLAAVIAHFDSINVDGRAALTESVADWFGHWYADWHDGAEFLAACGVKTVKVELAP